ncbi:MAG TPA: LuxR C-terminal-related transcriptional regulator [Chloroflexia bacterium]|nr:LuxR C-terminal-related transcriptional regulator [Chloroflexia bacterium]
MLEQSDVLVLAVDKIRKAIKIAKALRSTGCKAPMLLYTSRFTLPPLAKLLERGIEGLISSSSPSLKELEETIYRVAAREAGLLQQQYERTTKNLHCLTSMEGLTPKEIEILQLVASDYSDAMIAKALDLSVKTVNNRLSVIYAKLKVKTRAGAVAKAISREIIDV